jgi:hypothetical protein
MKRSKQKNQWSILDGFKMDNPKLQKIDYGILFHNVLVQCFLNTLLRVYNNQDQEIK